MKNVWLIALISIVLGAVSCGDKEKDEPTDDPAGSTSKAAIGDYYYSDGSFSSELNSAKTCVGIVFRAKTSDKSGLVVSHDERGPDSWWAPVTVTGYVYTLTNANDDDDGAKNLEKIKKWNNWENRHPVFYWCAQKGDGWYLPAVNELLVLTKTVAGNETLKAKLEIIPGGIAMERPNYWSSTEASLNSAKSVTTVLNAVVTRDKVYAKSTNVSARAVKSF